MKKEKNITKNEFTMHAILSGVLLNGFIQGQTRKILDSSVIDVALKELKKIT
jgi:hypothetical protein